MCVRVLRGVVRVHPSSNGLKIKSGVFKKRTLKCEPFHAADQFQGWLIPSAKHYGFGSHRVVLLRGFMHDHSDTHTHRDQVCVSECACTNTAWVSQFHKNLPTPNQFPSTCVAVRKRWSSSDVCKIPVSEGSALGCILHFPQRKARSEGPGASKPLVASLSRQEMSIYSSSRPTFKHFNKSSGAEEIKGDSYSHTSSSPASTLHTNTEWCAPHQSQ